MMRHITEFPIRFRSIVCILGILMIPAGTAYSQSMEPDEPELVLPRLLLEINDLSVETVETVLPDQSRPEVPKLVLPMPEERELFVPDSAFELSLPETKLPGSVPMNRESSVFSDGMIGMGSMNHILGSISIYKLGAEPRFNFQFSHEGLDGFASQNAGTGFSSREDILDASLNMRHLNMQSTVEGAFREREFGLQKKSTRYNSVLHRFLETENLFRLQPSDTFLLDGTLNAGLSNKIMTTRNMDDRGADNSFNEVFVSPTATATLSFDDLSIVFTGKYGFTMLSDRPGTELHRGLIRSAFSYDFSLPLYLEGSLGIYWTSSAHLYFPFSLGLSSRFQDSLSLFVKGGYAVEEQSYASLWNQVPYTNIKASGVLSDAHGFFMESGFSWLLTNGVTLDGKLAFSSLGDTLSVQFANDRFDPATGLFPVEQKLIMRLRPSLAFNWQWKDFLSLGLSYAGEFLQRSEQIPLQAVTFNVDLAEPAGRFGGNFNMKFEYFTTFVAPELNTSGFFRISDGVRFILELNDLLSPFIPDGRKYFGGTPYLSPGFRLTLKTQISL